MSADGRIIIGGTDVTDVISRCAENAPPFTEYQIANLRRIFGPARQAAQRDLDARKSKEQ